MKRGFETTHRSRTLSRNLARFPKIKSWKRKDMEGSTGISVYYMCQSLMLAICMNAHHINHNWLVVSTPLKNLSQLGWLFPIYGKESCSKPPTRDQSYFSGKLLHLYPVPAPKGPKGSGTSSGSKGTEYGNSRSSNLAAEYRILPPCDFWCSKSGELSL